MTTGGRTFAGRYSLDVQISTAVGTPVWRALDQVLRRWVTLYLMPRSDTRSPAVIASCLRVAANSSRNVVAILDVIEAGHITGIATISPSEDYLGIVSEWIEGETLDRRLTRSGEPFSPDAALDITGKVAAALAGAHELGISHGRLRPHNVVFSDSGEVRISGFGIETSVLGGDRTNGVQSDILGIGNLLFAMVTGSWPHESVDGLPAATSGAGIPEPSKITGGVTPAIDRFFIATQDGTYLSMGEVVAALSVGAVENTDESVSPLVRLASDVAAQVTPPQVKAGRTSRRVRPEEVRSESSALPVVAPTPAATSEQPEQPPRLAATPPVIRATAARLRASTAVDRMARVASVDRITSHPPVEWQGEPETASHRNRVTAIALGSVLVFGWIGWQILTSSFGHSDAPESLVVTPLATFSAVPSPSAATPVPVAVESITDYDPYGDKTENGALAPLAIDADVATAWQTVVYRGNNMAGKPGVGLLLDLGRTVDVTAVDLTFTATGHDATVFIGDSSTPDVKSADQLGAVSNGGMAATIQGDQPRSGRYVLVWLTHVPRTSSGSYQGGVAEVVVRAK